MRGRLSICVTTQTPLARFQADVGELYDKYGEVPDPLPLDMLTEGEDYSYAPGGVTRLLPHLFKRLEEKNVIRKPHWVSLNPVGPNTALSENATLHSISLPPHESVRYGRFKESLWKNIHSIEQSEIPKDDFPGYALYNWLTTQKMLELNSENDFDLFYVHDFQLLPTGSMLGPTAPKLFRWHIPLDVGKMLPQWRKFLISYLQNYEATIVSCERYKEELLSSGFEGEVHQLYPHIDPNQYGTPTRARKNKFMEDYGLDEDDRIILVVARLDPMKGQDIAIKGVAKIAEDYPDAKLLLVGNGSFSSSEKGGLGLPKGLKWKKELEDLAEELGIEDRIIFTGFVQDEELEAALDLSEMMILPSKLEGFGLTVLEAWTYKKPTIISKGAGIAELAEEGENSYVFGPSDHEELSEKIRNILSDREHAEELGERGYETSKRCHLDRVSDELTRIIEETMAEE